MQRMMVVGMGITGRAVATALQQRGIDVVALDDRISDELRSWSTDNNLVVHAPGDVNIDALLAQVDGVLPAPGLPDHHPIFAAAAQAKAPIMSEFDLAALWDDRPAVAITGTDGKTTVVTLVERMLEQSGITAKAVGNTDTPWVEAIDDPATDVFVVEASSFRLGHSQHFSPSIGTWLNFGPDHLDAHR
ncbi:MAG: Mur ligase family protein, partial [Acidimicrobiales bacterium]